jgi:hypothetical protein
VNAPVHIVLRCADALVHRVRYVFDTLLMACNIRVVYAHEPPTIGPWILYAETCASGSNRLCLWIAHLPGSWELFSGRVDVKAKECVDGLAVVLPQNLVNIDTPNDIAFDIIANAFYFLTSWSERLGSDGTQTRKMYANSVFARLGVPQDIVDQYLTCIVSRLQAKADRAGWTSWEALDWPGGSGFAIVLSHDVDFIPYGLIDTLKQGAKTAYRHLVRQRDVAAALAAMTALARALATGRDAYGCVPDLIAKETRLGVRASFQVAVANRHPDDVAYRIEDEQIRNYLRVIPDSGFDLCLHGSYRSTENAAWYAEEVALLSRQLGAPAGSRQHFLSFDYDVLFEAQERAGIRYDMSMGFPDRIGPRAGFSYPYFPYSLERDRPFDVVEISLFLMDVTLRSYMGLKGARAWNAVANAIDDLCRKRGCVSAVWHPIVFGGARDPGYDQLFWKLVENVRARRGLATDGRTIDTYWRGRARAYPSFSVTTSSHAPTRIND